MTYQSIPKFIESWHSSSNSDLSWSTLTVESDRGKVVYHRLPEFQAMVTWRIFTPDEVSFSGAKHFHQPEYWDGLSEHLDLLPSVSAFLELAHQLHQLWAGAFHSWLATSRKWLTLGNRSRW